MSSSTHKPSTERHNTPEHAHDVAAAHRGNNEAHVADSKQGGKEEKSGSAVKANHSGHGGKEHHETATRK